MDVGDDDDDDDNGKIGKLSVARGDSVAETRRTTSRVAIWQCLLVGGILEESARYY